MSEPTPYLTDDGIPRPRDVLDAFVETLHALLGHDKTAAYLQVPAGDHRLCRLCQQWAPRPIVAPSLDDRLSSELPPELQRPTMTVDLPDDG